MSDSFTIQSIQSYPFARQGRIFVAGPCSAESPEQLLQTALAIASTPLSILRAGIWKPRTRPGSFEGVGERGLGWLKEAGMAAKVPVATEVADSHQVELCLKAGIDILWVGARTTTNPFAVQAICDALQGVDIPVMVKNPMNADIELWLGALERLNKAGCSRMMAIHRGFATFRRGRLRNQPIWRIPVELRRRLPQLPILCDPSHISGDRELIAEIAQEAMDLLFDGLMIEVHNNPNVALSDANQQLTPAQYGVLMQQLRFRTPSVEDNGFAQQLQLLRGEIDTLDENVIALLARRMELVEEIGALKQSRNVASHQPERWKTMLDKRLVDGLQKGLAQPFVKQLFELVHEEALRRQELRAQS
jgi:chorismate mutase